MTATQEKTRRWTMICWDADKSGQNLGMRAHVRLVPHFMDTEAAGWAWGFSIGGVNFATEEEADVFAGHVENFMDAAIKALEEKNQDD